MKNAFKAPAFEIEQRTKRLQAELQKEEIEGMLIVQRADLFYFSGTAQDCYLYIPATGAPLLLVKKYMPRARLESSIKDMIEIKSVKDAPLRIADVYGTLPHTLGLEFDVVPVKDFNFYQQIFPKQHFVDGSSLIHKVRMIKSEWEITQIERTAELSCHIFDYIKDNLRPGYTEIEFAGIYETFARKIGHGAKLRTRNYQAEMTSWHILSGRSGGLVGVLDSPCSGEGTSIAFPCGGGNKELVPNEPIMIDLGSVMNGYHFDETRMFAIDSMPQKALDAGLGAIEIHNEVLEKVRPGMGLYELFELSTAKAESLGYADSYLGPSGYKTNFIGHGIGVELVEPPFISAKNRDFLQAGMMFALEPKLVFENEFAAGIESVFLVTEKGHRLISRTPMEIFVC